MTKIFIIIYWCGVTLFSSSIGRVAPPPALLAELSSGLGHELSSVQKLPKPLQRSLAAVFEQDKLDLANPSERFAGDTFIVREGARMPPVRRLIFAFETSRHFVVYLEYGPPATHTGALAFQKALGGNPVFVWGGTELGVRKRAKTSAELAKRILRQTLDDEAGTLW